MRQFRTYGSVRGTASNGRPYRDSEPESIPNLSGLELGPSVVITTCKSTIERRER
jgi:hypothetical protein